MYVSVYLLRVGPVYIELSDWLVLAVAGPLLPLVGVCCCWICANKVAASALMVVCSGISAI